MPYFSTDTRHNDDTTKRKVGDYCVLVWFVFLFLFSRVIFFKKGKKEKGKREETLLFYTENEISAIYRVELERV